MNGFLKEFHKNLPTFHGANVGIVEEWKPKQKVYTVAKIMIPRTNSLKATAVGAFALSDLFLNLCANVNIILRFSHWFLFGTENEY